MYSRACGHLRSVGMTRALWLWFLTCLPPVLLCRFKYCLICLLMRAANWFCTRGFVLLFELSTREAKSTVEVEESFAFFFFCKRLTTSCFVNTFSLAMFYNCLITNTSIKFLSKNGIESSLICVTCDLFI